MKNYFKADGHLNENALASYSQTKDPLISKHLEQCESCNKQYQLLNDFLEEHHYIEERTKKTNSSSYLKLVALLLIALSFGYLSFFQNSTFDRHEILDSFLKSELRSGKLHILEPQLEEVYQNSKNIHFRVQSSNPNFDIEILSNTNKVLHQQKINSTSKHLNISLDEGLYYWKLVRDDEILYIGSFIIKP